MEEYRKVKYELAQAKIKRDLLLLAGFCEDSKEVALLDAEIMRIMRLFRLLGMAGMA